MLKQIPIVPNGRRYWVLSDKAEDTKVQVGGYTLEENGGKKKPPLQGRVIARGDANGPNLEDRCKYRCSDLVVFGAYSGNPHVWDGVEYIILHEEEILGHIVETPFDERDTTDLTKQ